MSVETISKNNLAIELYSRSSVTENDVSAWMGVVPVLLAKHAIDSIEISPVMANKYRFDMYGLFLELNVTDSHILPHILANGYTSSNDYDAEILNIKMLDPYTVNEYVRRFKK